MGKNRIEKGATKAAFQLSDGEWIDGEVFLSLYDEHHSGAQTMDDLLSCGDPFIPVKTEAAVTLLNVRHIVQAKIDRDKEEDELMRLGEKQTVWVKTVLGEEVMGDVYISLPEGRDRVKDYANANPGFLRLFQTNDILYLNPNGILFLHD